MYLIVIILLLVAMYWYYTQEKFMAANWMGQYGAQTIRPVMAHH
jgi:hypothetical protein